MTSFVFDVDGTLTDARQKIDPEFEKFMMQFTRMHTCFICTGSDRPKTLEQIGQLLTDNFEAAFHCSGNHIYQQGREIYKSDWQISDQEYWFLEDELKQANYKEKTGNHIEKRIGMVNFSVVGRNANLEQRKRYAIWDKKTNTRNKIAERYNDMFGHKSQAVVGGDTSIDIFKLGGDKSQVKKLIDDDIVFFGDKCFPGGNDYALSQIAEKFYQIDNGWQQTFEILKNEYHKQ